MTTLGLTVWIATIVVVALVIVPVALSLLGRSLRAARAIEKYLADMLEAGAQIAGHSEAVPTLDDTLSAAGSMIPVAESIEQKTGAVAGVLASRAEAS